MASYSGYIPALDASDYDTKIEAFINAVETDMSAAQTTISSHTTAINANTLALNGTQDITLNDGIAFIVGGDSDTFIKHINGTGTEIRHDGTDGSLFLYSGSTSIELNSSEIKINADIYVYGSTAPGVHLIPNSSGGDISYNMYDSATHLRGSFVYTGISGDISLSRLNIENDVPVLQTKLVLNDNKTVSVYGASVSDPGADPVNDSDLCNKSYTDGKVGGLNTKIVEIGDWDMYYSGIGILKSLDIYVAHGLTLSKIRNISVTIRNDDNDRYSLFNGSAVNSIYAEATLIRIVSLSGGNFDTSNYNSSSYNRGWITIQYTD